MKVSLLDLVFEAVRDIQEEDFAPSPDQKISLSSELECDLGIDSLDLVKLIISVEKKCGYDLKKPLSADDVPSQYFTILDLIKWIRARRKGTPHEGMNCEYDIIHKQVYDLLERGCNMDKSRIDMLLEKAARELGLRLEGFIEELIETLASERERQTPL